MKLYERLPTYVLVGGRRYHLRPAFDRVLQAIDVMQMPASLDRRLTAVCALLIRERNVPQKERVIAAALDALGFPPTDASKPGSDPAKRVFDWTIDADYIYAAFWQTYHIDLYRCTDRGLFSRPLHWCKFIALFSGLPNDTRLSEVIAVRAQDVPAVNAYNREAVARLLQQKARLALPRTEEQRQNDLQAGLLKVFRFLYARAKETNEDHK